MKKTVLYFTLVLLCLAMLPVGAMAGALDGRSGETSASVSFVEGELSFGGDVGGSGMALLFGEHAIPVSAVNYPAVNQSGGSAVSHVLPVEDARYASGSWFVTVALSNFIHTPQEGDPVSFEGLITFTAPAVANSNTAASTDGLTVADPIAVASGLSPARVMTADNTLPRGLFTATWTNDHVVLSIVDAEVAKIGPGSYAATMTWTLTLGP